MKKIWTDFNDPNPNRPRISEQEFMAFNLTEGELAIFYSDDIQVEVKVMYDPDQASWCGEVLGEAMTVSAEIEEARNDGFINGEIFGTWTERDNLIRNMRSLKLNPKLIEQITGIPRSEIIRRY